MRNGMERPRRRGRLTLPFSDLAGFRDGEVELVRPVGLDLDLLLRPLVVLGRDSVHGDDVGAARATGLLLAGGGLAVAGCDHDPVLAWLQPGLALDRVLAIGYVRTGGAPAAVERLERDRPGVERRAFQGHGSGDPDAAVILVAATGKDSDTDGEGPPTPRSDVTMHCPPRKGIGGKR